MGVIQSHEHTSYSNMKRWGGKEGFMFAHLETEKGEKLKNERN